MLNPSLRGKAVAVGGNEEERHGIILAKNEVAKKQGVKTGETLWQARLKCPDLIIVPPHYEEYVKISEATRQIYNDNTYQVEPFGLDEAWLDVTGEDGVEAAKRISNRIKRELGITVSVGVSFNKVFAKLGSDYKKPDAVTVITKDNYKNIVWNLIILINRKMPQRLLDGGRKNVLNGVLHYMSRIEWGIRSIWKNSQSFLTASTNYNI